MLQGSGILHHQPCQPVHLHAARYQYAEQGQVQKACHQRLAAQPPLGKGHQPANQRAQQGRQEGCEQHRQRHGKDKAEAHPAVYAQRRTRGNKPKPAEHQVFQIQRQQLCQHYAERGHRQAEHQIHIPPAVHNAACAEHGEHQAHKNAQKRHYRHQEAQSAVFAHPFAQQKAVHAGKIQRQRRQKHQRANAARFARFASAKAKRHQHGAEIYLYKAPQLTHGLHLPSPAPEIRLPGPTCPQCPPWGPLPQGARP